MFCYVESDLKMCMYIISKYTGIWNVLIPNSLSMSIYTFIFMSAFSMSSLCLLYASVYTAFIFFPLVKDTYNLHAIIYWL